MRSRWRWRERIGADGWPQVINRAWAGANGNLPAAARLAPAVRTLAAVGRPFAPPGDHPVTPGGYLLA